MLTAADLRVLQLVKHDEGFPAKRFVESAEETLRVLSNLLMNFINVALDREEVCLDSTALGTVLGSHFCSKNLNAERPHSLLRSNLNSNLETYLAVVLPAC